LPQGRELLETEVSINNFQNFFVVIFVFTSLDGPGSVFDISSDFQLKAYCDMTGAGHFLQMLHS
jgi:hypothetical protein